MYCQSERQKKMDTCDEDWKDGSIESILIEKGFSTQAFLKKQDEIRTLLNSPPKPNFKLTSSVSSHKIPSSLTSTSSIDQVLLNFNQTFTSVTTQPITSTSTSLNQTSSPMSISPNLDLITHRNLTQLNRPDRLHQSDRTPTLERQPSPTLSNLKPHNQATLDHHPRAIISLHTHNHLHRLPPAYSLPSLPIHSLSNHSHKTNQPIPFDLNLKTTDSLTSPLMSSNTLSSDDDFSSPQPDFSTSDTSSPRSTPAALYLQPPTLHSARSNQRSVRTLDSILTCKMKKTLDYLPPFDKASDHPTTTNTISSCFNSNLDHSFSNSQPTSTATTTATAATTTTTTTPAFTPFSSSNSQLNHIINLSPNADLCTRNNPHDLSSSSSSTTIPPSSEALLDQCKRSGPTHTPSLHTHPPSSSSSSPLSPLSPSSSSSSHPHHQSKPRARSVEIESGLQSKHPQQKRARDTSSPPAHASHHVRILIGPCFLVDLDPFHATLDSDPSSTFSQTFSNLLSSPILRSFRDDQNPSTAHPIPLSSPARPCLTPRYTLSLDTDSNSKAVPAEAQPRSSSPSDLAGPQTRLPYASNARSDTLSAGRLTSPSPPFQLSSPSPSCTSPQADPPTYPPITSPASRRSFQLSDPPEPKSTVARLLHFPSAPAQSSPPTQSQSRTHHLTKVSAYHTSPRPLPSPLTSLRSPSLAHRTPHSHPISEQCPTFSPALLSSSSSYPEFNLNPNGSSNPNEKPTYSYAALIGQAIMCSESKKSCLNDIYAYIMNNYSYYRKEEAGWQNSIRHNLSLNESFVKVPRGPNEPGKGSFWAIAPGAEDQFANGGFKKKSNSSNPEPSRRSKATGTSRRRGKPNSNNEDPPSGSGPSPVSAPPLGSLQIGYPPNSLHGHHSPRSIFASRPYPHLAPPRSAGPHHRNPVDLMTAAMSHRRSRLDPPKIYTRPDLQPSTTHSASRSDPHARIRDEPSRGPAHGIERSPTLARQDRFTTHRLTSPLVIPHHQYLSSTKRSRADEDGDGDGDDARPQRQHSFLLSSPSISSASAVPSRPSLEEGKPLFHYHIGPSLYIYWVHAYKSLCHLCESLDRLFRV